MTALYCEEQQLDPITATNRGACHWISHEIVSTHVMRLAGSKGRIQARLLGQKSYAGAEMAGKAHLLLNPFEGKRASADIQREVNLDTS